MKSILFPNNNKLNNTCFLVDEDDFGMVGDVYETTSTSSGSDVTDEDDVITSSADHVDKYSSKENDEHKVLWPNNRTKRLDDYRRRRQRNNMAVKKSRDKAKQRQKECARHLEFLTAENKRLHMKAEVLMKELNLLKGLFPVVGLTPPPESDELLLG